MKINWLEYERKEHVLAWLLVEAMSKVGMNKFGDFDSSKLDVVLTVNGIEVPVEDSMDFLQSQLHAIGKEGYDNGYKQATQDIHEKLGEFIGAYDDGGGMIL